MDTKALRQKILDLAIRGKLVPQDPNDEPASVLLERIRAEKERLIAESKIKRPKQSKTATKPHYPEDLPEGWEVAQIGDIAFVTKLAGFEYSNYIANNLSSSGIPLFKGKNIQDGEIIYKFESYIPESVSNALERSQINKKCLLTPYVGTIGNVGIHDKHGKYHLGSNVGKIELFISETDGFNEEYLRYFLMSSFGYKELTKKKKATAQESISIEAIRDVKVLIPPKEEISRILHSIHVWLNLIKEIETETSHISSLITQAKSKILSLAIQGKLVDQDPNDEPAEVLLKRINPEWKPCDKSQYENLPKGWAKCKLEDVIYYEQPQKYIVASTEYSEIYPTPVLTAGKSFIIGYTNETDGIFTNVPVIIFDDFTTESKFVDFPFKVKSSAMKILHVKEGIDIRFIYLIMSIKRLVGETHKRYWISEYSKISISLPPLAEQKRIVAKVHNLFSKIDEIATLLQ